MKSTTIKMIGVGGAGCNAISHIKRHNIGSFDNVAVAGDKVALEHTDASIKILTKEHNITIGRGDPDAHAEGALEKKDEISSAIRGADVIFILAGMGGVCGTGVAPIIAGIANDMEIMVFSIVTKPFCFEGQNRIMKAENGIIELAKMADYLTVIPLDIILLRGKPMNEAFEFADELI